MKTIGLLGGMSWESTAQYYRWINEETRRRRGGLHSAPLLISSVDFEPIELMQREGRWDGAATLLATEARRLERAGADVVLLCTNTMHKVADVITEAIDVPFIHIADATAKRILDAGMRTVGLFGTQFTMEEPFYKGRLESAGLTVLVPESRDRAMIHHVIYNELCQGIVDGGSRGLYVEAMERLRERGAEGVIEGCTEIGMLVTQEHTSILLFDTALIHAQEAVSWALETS